MGLFDSAEEWEKEVNERAQEHALSIAAGLSLPVCAQSLTAQDIRHKDQAFGTLLFLVYAGIAGIGVLLSLGNATRDGLAFPAFILLVAVLGGVVIFTLARARALKRKDYVDPQIRIDVAQGGITFAAPAGSHELRFAEVEARFTTYTHKNSVHFVGLKLQSPFGPLELDDGWFKKGRHAAAMIVRRVSEDHATRLRD